MDTSDKGGEIKRREDWHNHKQSRNVPGVASRSRAAMFANRLCRARNQKEQPTSRNSQQPTRSDEKRRQAKQRQQGIPLKDGSLPFAPKAGADVVARVNDEAFESAPQIRLDTPVDDGIWSAHFAKAIFADALHEE